jgi:transcriptional regulator with XRE-family HTH domain
MALALSERDRERLSLFVDEMRAMRTERGWSRAELAAHAQYSESLIAMVETYQRAPTQALAKALDRAFQTPGFTEDTPGKPGTPGTFGRLWLKLRNISFPEPFRAYMEHEEKAKTLRCCEHSLVPGLLQTEAYARAVMYTRPGATEEDVESDVAVRMARQRILTRGNPHPPWLWVLIDEGILYRPVAPAKVMNDQLVHVIEVSHWPQVSIQVVPYVAGGHSGLSGAFIIADFATEPSVVYLADAAGSRIAESTETVSYVSMRFETLRSEALPKAASRDLMAKVAEERWTT